MSKRGENIYKRNDGRWEGRYHKGRKSDRSIYYGYVYGQTYQEVKEKLYSYKVQYQTILQLSGQSAIPFNEWGQAWLKAIQVTVKPSTFASYSHKLNTYVSRQFQDLPLNQLAESHVQELIETLQEQLSPSTIRVVIQILNRCLSYAVKKGCLYRNPCEDICLPKPKKKPSQALSKKEQRLLQEIALEAPRSEGLPILLALHTGLRIGEVAGLKWSDIDLGTGIIRVGHTYQRIPTTVGEQRTKLVCLDPKTAASKRIVPLTDQLKEWLLQWQAKQADEFVFSVKGKPCEPRLLTYYFHRLRQKAKIGPVHFHQLRHTFATRCIESNGDIASVSALLGHASTQMTLDIYTDALMEQRLTTISRMEQAISA